MKKRFMSIVIATVAILTVLAALAGAQASDTGSSISIAFARDEPSGAGCALDPTADVGAPGYETKHWVNEVGATGTDSTTVVRDDKGIATGTSATVTWSSNNTWASFGRSESNNNFDGGFGDNFLLMQGYLDSSSRHDGKFDLVTVTGLPADIASGYSVVLYTLGGVRGRFAKYTVNTAAPLSIVPGGDDNGADNVHHNDDYFQALGDPDYGDNSYGNYAVVSGLSGDLTITAEPRNFRAALNAIQIIKNP
jgi:hypothetical protein